MMDETKCACHNKNDFQTQKQHNKQIKKRQRNSMTIDEHDETMMTTFQFYESLLTKRRMSTPTIWLFVYINSVVHSA